MKATFWQRGEALDYKNAGTSAIEANTVVKIGTTRVGVAGTKIEAGEEGTLHVTGVFEMDKSSTNEIKFGTAVYFDGTGITEAADDGQSEKTYYNPAGYAAADAAASADKILVKLLG